MYTENNHVYIEEDDQCMSCKHYQSGVACPLIEALATGVTFLTEPVGVKNCGFYEKYERPLKVVRKSHAKDNIESEAQPAQPEDSDI